MDPKATLTNLLVIIILLDDYPVKSIAIINVAIAGVD